jgi:putative ABC transport system permease protein
MKIMQVIKSALRSFFRFKLYTGINLFGLLLGMTCSIVILLYVSFELSFDQFQKDKEHIFRVNEISTSPQEHEIGPAIRIPYGPAMKEAFSEIEDVLRITIGWHNNLLKYKSHDITIKKVIYADSNLFHFFSFQLLEGNLNDILTQKNSIVLTQKIAQKLFGNEPTVGALVTYDTLVYTVTGIVANAPINSHIQFDVIFPMDNLLKSSGVYSGWDYGQSVTTFVKLRNKESKASVEAKLPAFLWEKVNKKNNQSGFKIAFYLEPLTHIHLFSEVDWDNFNKTDSKNIFVLLTIGLLILIVAIVNYIFISNGTLIVRIKEFSIKKYLGMGKSSVLMQILTENFMLYFIAGLLSYLILIAFKQDISQLFGVDFITFEIYRAYPYLIAGIVFISLFVGWVQYQWFRYKMERTSFISAKTKTEQRQKLATVSAFQFCISIGLIAAMTIVYQQLNFALHKDLGFTTHNIINISHGSVGSKQNLLISEIQKLPGVANVSASYGIPGLETTANGYRPEGAEQWELYSAMFVDDNFLETFNIKLLEGKTFQKGSNNDSKAFLVNETLVKQMNWDQAVGKNLFRDGNHEIIGVVKDFHVGLIYSKIPPLIISKESPQDFYSLSIALKPIEIQQTIKQIKVIWEKLLPNAPFSYSFMDVNFQNLYAEIKRTGSILFIFTCLSLLISMLGLFGITFQLLNVRIKEIGIRKVNGASLFEILRLLISAMLKWVIVGFIIAIPVTYYIMNQWLASFAYKITIAWWMFAFAGIIAICISLVTVSWQTILTARRNPVDSLRYE